MTKTPLTKDSTIGTRYEYDPKKVPKKYRDMVGRDSFFKSMLKLKKIKERNKLEIIILISHDYPGGISNDISKLCNRFGFHALYRRQNIQDPSLILSKEDTHPSALEHSLIAASLFEFMIKEKIIKELVKR